MNLLNFSDLLRNAGINPTKVKLIRHSKRHDLFRMCYEKNMVFEYTRCQEENFSKGYDYWAVFISETGTYARFFALYKVNGNKADTPDLKPKGFPIEDWFQGNMAYYNLSESDLLKDYNGRLIIDWGKATISWHQKGTNEKPIIAIQAAERKSFPGFENVLLTFDELKEMVDNDVEYEMWHTALSAVNAVYLIADRESGKQYVGSAYGEDGLWGRWREYANTTHGNNVLMKELLGTNPDNYHNFQFSVLQVLPKITDAGTVTKIETLWKNKLLTKDFGLNKN